MNEIKIPVNIGHICNLFNLNEGLKEGLVSLNQVSRYSRGGIYWHGHEFVMPVGTLYIGNAMQGATLR